MDASNRLRTDRSAGQSASNTGPGSISGAINRAGSPLSTALIPINSRGPVATDQSDLPRLLASPDISRKRIARYGTTPVGKRLKATTGNSNYTDIKQPLVEFLQTPTSLRAVKVEEPAGKTQERISAGKYDAIRFPVDRMPDHERYTQVQRSTTTIEQFKPQMQSSLTLNPASVCHHNHLTRDATIGGFPWPMDIPHAPRTTPENTAEDENAHTLSVIVNSTNQVALGACRTTTPKGVDTCGHVSVNDERNTSSDAYPLDDEIAQLLAEASNFIEEKHIPPSSIQGWDHESRSAEEYDPNLKYSPTDLQEATYADTAKMAYLSTICQPGAPEDLLDEDVDWNAVLSYTSSIQKHSSVESCPDLDASIHKMSMDVERPGAAGPHSNKVGPLAAFVRPPFPEKVRDRPSVLGMSSGTLLRTCFRIGVMISQTVQCSNHQQDVVFELYARVTYSSRETLARKQHFQFVDLFKDQQPYPAAVLTNWRAGSQIDKDSSTFLETNGGPRLCWCMCKPIKDPRAVVGWTYTVLKIKETNWEDIRWAKRVVCGDP